MRLESSRFGHIFLLGALGLVIGMIFIVLSFEAAQAHSVIATGEDAPEAEATIQVKPVVEVDGANNEITFGDLIVAHGVSDALLESVRSVRLADTPKAGESRSFTAVGIEEVFRPHLKEIEEKIGEKITLRVPPRVIVSRKVFRLQPQDVERELRAQLSTLCNDCQFELTDLRLPILAPRGQSWVLKMRQELPKGSFTTPLEITNEDGSKRTYWVSGVLTTRKVVPVATRNLQGGDKIQDDDFKMELRDITFAGDSFANQHDIATSVLSKQISNGQIIWRSGLKRELAVKNGDSLKVIAGGDAWQITIDGIAQGNGYIGDLIRVKIPRTQKLISGLLKEKGLVEVQ